MKKKERGMKITEKLSRALDIPIDALGEVPCVEWRGRGELLVRGCRKILEYGAESMILDTVDGILHVDGKKLICVTYIGGAVGLRGRIDSVRYDA